MNKEPLPAALVFTATFEGIAPVIYTEASIYNPGKGILEKHPVKALWDTGANCSCISKRMSEKLGLSAENYAFMTTASGAQGSPTYLVNIEIAGGFIFPELEVSEFFLGNDDSDLIIGMDVITQGDLAISNWEGITAFSFRVPSLQRIDFSTFS